ncbi:complex I intermediate-associated protein 30 (CIA30) [Neolewinella xylanilytica]|uniref:Complex I intermediate-associated protein 30 (CIA30) n=1 Tax=Neolewinella xylanilytica TaxID=1514080 RepID=A0A2S6I3W3_9BACT|nr:CIA30 family protein [Neolewinella xylanilytica]PPK85751.1 complex I intermediate-associated protein 30 (CIA30) [Neolewinella xylanilytica]
MNPPQLLYAFNEFSVRAQWRVVDDIVMGGHSDGHFAITPEKHGRFYGDVSLKDGGGFSSVRHRFNPPFNAQPFNRIFIRLKGDGSDYKFRLKSDPEAQFAYVHPFATSGEWEVIEITLAEMYPVRKGKRLDLPNFPGDVIGEISFLIANGREQPFQLLIDRLEML